MNKKYVVASLTIIGLFAFSFFCSDGHSVGEATPPVLAESGIAPPTSSVPKVAPQLVGVAGQREVPSGLADELKVAPSYRAFVYRAIRSPERGGYMYAQHVITLCRRALLQRDVPSLDSVRHAAAVTLAQRCDMSKDDLDQYDRELPEIRSAAGDPLLALATDGLIGARSQAERNVASAKILASKEPLLLRSISSVEVEKLADGSVSMKEYFNGKWYRGNDVEMLDFAWALANCELGVDCSASAPSTLQLCVDKGLCRGSLQDALSSGSANYDELLRLKKAIISAINEHDIRAFVGPDGNPPLFK